MRRFAKLRLTMDSHCALALSKRAIAMIKPRDLLFGATIVSANIFPMLVNPGFAEHECMRLRFFLR
jgi:hypothetical protein